MFIFVIPPNSGDEEWIEKLMKSPALVQEIEDETLRGPEKGGRAADAEWHLETL